MTLQDLKKKGKLTNDQLALMFRTTRQRISRWLDGSSEMPIWVVIYLNWLG